LTNAEKCYIMVRVCGILSKRRFFPKAFERPLYCSYNAYLLCSCLIGRLVSSVSGGEFIVSRDVVTTTEFSSPAIRSTHNHITEFHFGGFYHV